MLQAELAVFLLGINHAGDRSGHADRLVSDLAGAGDHVSLLVEVHVRVGCGGSLLAVIEEMRLAVGHADEHEPSATDVSCRRMDDGEGKSRSNGGVHRIAARAA